MKLPKINKHYLKLSCLIVLAAILIFQGVFDYVVITDRHNNTDTNAQLSSALIFNAIDTLLKPAPVDAQTGDVYFPDAKLKIAAPDSLYPLMQLEYTYTPSSQGQPEQLNVTDTQIMSFAQSRVLAGIAVGITKDQAYQDMFAAVPRLQNCAHAISVYFSAQNTKNMDGNYSAVGSALKLADGRSAYIYQDKTCSTPVSNNLVSIIKKIQSYTP